MHLGSIEENKESEKMKFEDYFSETIQIHSEDKRKCM